MLFPTLIKPACAWADDQLVCHASPGKYVCDHFSGFGDFCILTLSFFYHQLRCTGRIGDCDGCRSRSIACFLPSNSGNSPPNVHPSGPRPVFRQPIQKPRSQPSRVTPTESDANDLQRAGRVNYASSSSHNSEPSPSASATLSQEEDRSGREVWNDRDVSLWDPNSWIGNPTTVNFDDHDISAVLLDIEEFARCHPQMDSLAPSEPHAGSNDRLFDADTMQYNFSHIQPLPAQSLPTVSTPLSPRNPPPRSLDKFVMADATARNQNMENVEKINLQVPTNSHTQSESSTSTSPRDSSSSSRNNTLPDACSCLYNTVRVVQQLDDDDFRITSMTLGQVSQLQKWIMTQCYKALDCPTCKSLSAVHTVLTVVCDRLAEMFECIHKRIKRSNQQLTGRLSDTSSSSPSSSGQSSGQSTATNSPIDRSGEQLFCATSRRPAAQALCNTEIFSADFHQMYTNEEQVHMIRALLKLQVRNFRTLLVRIGNASQFVEARQSRIEAMNSRLVRAANDIENALRASLQHFKFGGSRN